MKENVHLDLLSRDPFFQLFGNVLNKYLCFLDPWRRRERPTPPSDRRASSILRPSPIRWAGVRKVLQENLWEQNLPDLRSHQEPLNNCTEPFAHSICFRFWRYHLHAPWTIDGRPCQKHTVHNAHDVWRVRMKWSCVKWVVRSDFHFFADHWPWKGGSIKKRLRSAENISRSRLYVRTNQAVINVQEKTKEWITMDSKTPWQSRIWGQR